jgi:hypothetical protein
MNYLVTLMKQENKTSDLSAIDLKDILKDRLKEEVTPHSKEVLTKLLMRTTISS